ncbi:hypothetical protein BDN70DRAFT_24775 [Pholiota conissans]|uniref:Uncharacterized protein n=1 Tax=Pholiota conissans TaxID=109636 RepID=A0A9P6D6P8_9AGAR|nr:hypothetical protein BDN70DRAFT_24775 [Pholiota conissans]
MGATFFARSDIEAEMMLCGARKSYLNQKEPERLEVLIVDFSHETGSFWVGRGERSSTRRLRSSLLTSFLKFDRDSTFRGPFCPLYMLGTSCSVLTLLFLRRYTHETNHKVSVPNVSCRSTSL